MLRPFRFALQARSAGSGAAWRQLARKAEDLGYSTLFLPDHFDDQLGPLTALAGAAAATERLKVGTLVLSNDYRHPVVLAKEAATLDLLADGRLELGLGAGWLRSDYDAAGMTFDPPGVRIERLAEAVAVMKALWATGSCDFSGRHYRVTGAVGSPRPATRPHPTLLLAGGGRRMLSLAAREADIVGFNTRLSSGAVDAAAAAASLPERFAERVAWVREAAGDRFEGLELQCHTFFCQVTTDRRQLAEAMAPMFGLTAEQAVEVPLVLIGTVEEICDDLVRRREAYGFSYWTVRGDAMESFAPVVERLAGR